MLDDALLACCGLKIIFVTSCYKYYISVMETNDNEIYAALKKRLLRLGIPIPGTLHALYARCGSPTCPCATDKQKRHGPYYRWHYRLSGRSAAHGINIENLVQFTEWIENREKIYRVVEEMLAMGIRTAMARLQSDMPGHERSKRKHPKIRKK